MAVSRPDSAFERLIQRLVRLPGIGNRSAQRIAFHLIKSSPQEAAELAHAIERFTSDLRVCSTCGHVSESDPCPICLDERRDRATLLVVEQPSDVTTLEQLGMYRGVYHVLMGRLEPLEGIGPGELNVERLIERVRDGAIQEVVLATNPTLEGDGTAMYLAERLSKAGVRVTRLARGLPTGANLAGVSKAVLADALQGRQRMGG